MPIVPDLNASSGSGPNLATLIERLRDAAGDFPSRDTLAAALAQLATAATFTDGTKISALSLIDFDDGTFESAVVLAKSSETAATLMRGARGSIPVPHGAGSPVLSGFRFRAAQYRRAINEALGAISTAWGRPVWDTSKSFSATDRMIEIPANAIRATVYAKPSSALNLTPVAATLTSAPPSLVPSGRALQLRKRNPGSGTAYVVYETLWPELLNTSDALPDEFPPDAYDLLIDGAIAYLLQPEMFKRLAYTSPHIRKENFVSPVSDARLAANQQLMRFLTRRSEVGARFASGQRIGWGKGS